MKKLITLTLALILFSCAKKETPEYTILSGKLTNNKTGKFTLRGNSFKKEIALEKDGTFTDTLYLDYNGAYEIGRQTIMYLHKGKNLSFEADAEKIDDIVFTGDLAAENSYIAQKARLQLEIVGNDLKALYSLEEADFLATIDQFNKKQDELLEATVFFIDNFKENEIRNQNYYKAFTCGRYESYHSYFVQNTDFQVSDNFPKADQTIDLDNADEFNFSTAYRQLVSADFEKKVREEYNKEVGEEEKYNEEKANEVTLKIFKTIRSQNIKNFLARDVAYGINPAYEKSEELYNELMSSITDENFKTELTEKYNKIKTLVKGNPSPKFDYENHKGDTTSLDELKGKYVYIDVWATWCGPCKREIPFLKEVEEQYHGKNIEFVSISIDEEKDHEIWKNFVTEQSLGGIQLYADNAWKSQFVTDYAIEGIPRFILIDTEGNIVSADAPRPSDPKLTELFEELGI